MPRLRKIWSILSFLMAIPVLAIVMLGALLYGTVQALVLHENWFYAVRYQVGRQLLAVYGKWIGASTWAYERLIGSSARYHVPIHERARQELLIVGHRGAPMQKCENTIASFAAAIRQGANALELDLCFTQDGEVVVWHDWDPDSNISLLRETGSEPLQLCKPFFGKGEFRRAVPQLTLAELRTHCGYVERVHGSALPEGQGHISTWREFLEAAKAWPELRMLFLDIKLPPCDMPLAEPMMAKIQADLIAVRPTFECVVMTIHPDVLAVFKAVAPQFRYCLDKQFQPYFHDTHPAAVHGHSAMRDALWLRHDFASIGRPTFLAFSPWEFYKTVLMHDLALRSKAAAKPWLIAWTINDPEEMRWLIHAGVDAILTDMPAHLAQIERRRKAILQFQQQAQRVPRTATGS